MDCRGLFGGMISACRRPSRIAGALLSKQISGSALQRGRGIQYNSIGAWCLKIEASTQGCVLRGRLLSIRNVPFPFDSKWTRVGCNTPSSAVLAAPSFSRTLLQDSWIESLGTAWRYRETLSHDGFRTARLCYVTKIPRCFLQSVSRNSKHFSINFLLNCSISFRREARFIRGRRTYHPLLDLGSVRCLLNHCYVRTSENISLYGHILFDSQVLVVAASCTSQSFILRRGSSDLLRSFFFPVFSTERCAEPYTI